MVREISSEHQLFIRGFLLGGFGAGDAQIRGLYKSFDVKRKLENCIGLPAISTLNRLRQ
jgi:hypothetical protein